MQEHELRVVTERDELQSKFDALGTFLAKGKPTFIDSTNWELLGLQYDAMCNYLVILNKRIGLFS